MSWVRDHGERWFRAPAVVAAIVATAAFVDRGGDALTTRVLTTGIAGVWILPGGLLVAALLCSSSNVARAGLSLGLCVPALADGLECVAMWIEDFAQRSHLTSAASALIVTGYVAASSMAAVARARHTDAKLLFATSVACGALLSASLGLCWWWPLVGSGGLIRGRLMVSPWHVLATTFFSLAARHLLRGDTRASLWLVAGWLAFSAAPHHGTHGIGCVSQPGPGLLETAWPPLLLGLAWAYSVHRRHVAAAVTHGNSAV